MCKLALISMRHRPTATATHAQSPCVCGAYHGCCAQVAGTCLHGMARLSSYIKSQRALMPTLVLDAGDQSTGTLWDAVYRWGVGLQ